jgi:predicted AAA+ superfamily ATPase
VTITGPRQSGKTTLAKLVFPELPYYSLKLYEIKSAQTFTKDFLKNLRYINKLLDSRIKSLTPVYDEKEDGTIENVRLVPFCKL